MLQCQYEVELNIPILKGQHFYKPLGKPKSCFKKNLQNYIAKGPSVLNVFSRSLC